MIYRIAAYGLLAASISAFGWLKGASHVQAKWDKQAFKDQLLIVEKEVIREKETVKIITEYIDRVKVVKEKGETIVKEIPVFITVENDNACIINNGFVIVHDSAAKGVSIAKPPRDADARASGITLSTIARTTASNYQRCHENAEQLKALQNWAKQMYQIQ